MDTLGRIKRGELVDDAFGVEPGGRDLPRREKVEVDPSTVPSRSPEAALDNEIKRTIGELLSSAPLAVASAKELIRAAGGLSLEEAIPVTSKWIAALRATPQAKEGMGAFLGKRKPNWIL